MGKGNKKPRKKLNPQNLADAKETKRKKEADWSFDDIIRSKTRRR